MSKGSKAKKSVSSAASAPSLFGVELVVLARLSKAAHSPPPEDAEIERAVRELCHPEIAPARAATTVVRTLMALRERRLVTGIQLTDEGARALRAAFGMSRRPTWESVRSHHLPMLGADSQQRTPRAGTPRSRREASTPAILCAKLGLGDASSVAAVCDALVVEALEMPAGKLTLDAIRAHVLARRCGVAPGGSPGAVAKRIVSQPANDAALALARQGLRARAEPLEPPGAPKPVLPVQPARSVPEDGLLSTVREMLPKIGSEGRFGSEKVFVSALWHRIEPARSSAELSLDVFKRWLVTANRDGWLQLARADLVGAMDPRQVAESEIRDRGATFHFVLDRHDAAAAQEANHA